MAMDPAAVAAAIRQTAQGYGPHVNWINKPAPGVHTILEQMFNLAHSEWAREFLFFPNPHVDAGILTSALNLQYKVAGQIKQDTKADRVGPYIANSYHDHNDSDTSSDDQLYCDWVIVPAFNFGQQGACYFMQKTASGGSTQDHNGAIRSALYRIITDDVTGEVLYVGDMPETDTYQVVHMTHLNGAYHQRAICFFEGSVFRAALTADNGRMSFPHIAKALVLCIHTRETRNCKTCGAHPSMCCNCPVSLRQSEHPHDLRFYAHNTRAHLGHYSGKDNVMYLKKGSVVATKTQYTLHRTNTDTDADTVLSLRRWAVNDRLGAVVQRSFGRFIQRPPISSVAVAAAIMNVNKSFDEVIDFLAEADNPNIVAHRHYTRRQGGSYSSLVSGGQSSGQSWGNSQGFAMVTDGSEVDISQPPMPEHSVNEPISISSLGCGFGEGSDDMQPVHAMRQARSCPEEVRLAEQLAAEQQNIERLQQLEQLRILEEQRQAVRQRQVVEQQELLQQRQFIQRQREAAHQQCLGDQQQQLAAIARRQAMEQEQLAQRQAIEQRELLRRQQAVQQQRQEAERQREMCQRQQVMLQHEGHMEDVSMVPAVAVHSMTRTSCAADVELQTLNGSGRQSAGSCRDDGAQGQITAILAGNGLQRAVSNMGANATNGFYFGKRPRSEVLSNTNYVPPVPCALSAEQIRAPIATPQAAGVSHPQTSAASSGGATIYSRSGAFRTAVVQSAMGGSTSALQNGVQNGSGIGVAANLRIGVAPTLRPAPVERRLLPRGSQPAPQVPEDPKKKRELDMRIRKREAARRSDARRLAKVQQLQVQTNEMERTANELRAKQAKLLDENAVLKRQVAALGTRVSIR